MAWVLLLASACLEAVWAHALAASNGLTRPLEAAIFLVATVLSVVGLGRAMREIPTGTAYAAWTGVGAVLTVAWGVATGVEPISPVKALLLMGIIGCVAALRTTEPPE